MRSLTSLYKNLMISSLFAAAIGCGGNSTERESSREKAQGYFQYVEENGANYLSFSIEDGNCYLQVSSPTLNFSLTDLDCNDTVDSITNNKGKTFYRTEGDEQFVIADVLYAKYKAKVEAAVGEDLAEIVRSL